MKKLRPMPVVRFSGIVLIVAVSGCAFDIVSVKQLPATLVAANDGPPDFTLPQDLAISIGTGFKTKLKKGTTWHRAGKIDQGIVFTTRDQVVTVEASHIYEAQPVVFDGRVVGFYLPVERTFAPATPIPIETKTAMPSPRLP